jgi:arsenate reductase-like glutaredoxin family protein
MANISLDIKANTSKALGEFKKLSRELDNKFLVQGLKLDVVKNAFRQITKEFDTALGDQGFKTSESTNQLQRNAAANLAALNKLGIDAAFSITKNMTNSLRDLEAQGEITNEALKETLNVAGFFDFSGSDAQIAAQFDSFSRRFAKFATDTNDAFGKSSAGQLQQVLTGKASIDSLLNLDFGAGGAGANVISKYLRERAGGNIQNLSPEIRTQIAEQLLKDIKDDTTEVGKVYKKATEQAKIDDPFRFLKREISSIFSSKGVFGNLRTLSEDAKFTNLNEQSVPENVLQLTANLLNTIFNKDKGLFAVLFKSLQDVFGEGDPLAPIIGGIKLLTRALRAVSRFFASDEFKSFLEIFKPLADTIRNIDVSNITIDLDTIKGFIGNIGEAIRELFNKSAEFIRNLDTKAVSEVLGTIIKELVKTIPSLLNLVFSSLGKVIGVLFDTINSSGGESATLIYSAIIAGFVNFADKLFGGPGLVGRIRNVLLNSFSKLAAALRLGAGSGGGAYRTNNQRVIDARTNRVTGLFNNSVIRSLNTIIRLLGGSAPLDPSGRGRDGPRRGAPGRDGRTASQRARNINRIRRSRRITGITSRIPGLRQLRSAQLARNFLGGAPRIPGASILSQGRSLSVGGLPGDYRNIPNRNNARIGSPAGLFQERAPRIPRPARFSNPVVPRVPTVPRVPLKPIVNPTAFVPPAAPGFAAPRLPRVPRVPSAGAGGILSRLGGVGGGAARGLGAGLKRIPLLGTLLSGLAIASIVGGPGASAAEMEGLTPEQKREQRRQDERGKSRGVLGVLGGVGGGALAGAGVGAALGAAGANPFTVAVGGVLGSIIGGIIGEEAVKALGDDIIDGVTGFAKKVGGFFTGLWEGTARLAGDGWKSVTAFFGPEGPIQSTFRFVTELPGNMVEGIKTGFENIKENITSLPETIWNSITEGFTGKQPGPSETNKKFLGGVGRGMTLVGENGPELVNLGSGSVVTPMTSFAGLGLSQGGSTSQPINNIVINVNAPGADEFAEQLSFDVIKRLDEMLEEEKTLQRR